MNKGAIVYTGTPAAVETNPTISHKFLGMGVAASRKGRSERKEASQ
jgi:hypothetical protein